VRAPDAAQRAALAAWCAADPGSMLHAARFWIPALRCNVKDAAPRPGHGTYSARSNSRFNSQTANPGYAFAFPRRHAPEVLQRTFAQKIRGRGERRVPAAPTASCAKEISTRVSTADTPEHPAFPHAMVLTVSFVLSQATGLVCHLRRRNEAPLQCPVGQEAPSAALTPASGRQDHTTSPSASHIVRPRAV
jgi:hypothetical protein